MKTIYRKRIAYSLLASAVLVAGGCGYKTNPVPPETIVPKAIEDLRYALDDVGVMMTWSYPRKTIRGTDIAEISSFELFRAEIPLDEYCPSCPVPYEEPIELDGGITLIDGKQRKAQYGQGMLRYDHKYFFKVKSKTDWWASSDDSNVISFTWSEPTPAPLNVRAIANDSRVELSWYPVTAFSDGRSFEGEMRYQVLRSPGDDKFRNIGELVEGTNFTDERVKNGQQYSYKVQSVRMLGEDDLVSGSISPVLSVTPEDTVPPSVPTGVVAIRMTKGIRLIWDSDVEEDISEYRVYRRVSGSKEYTFLAAVPFPAVTFIDEKPVKGKRNYYAVSAVDRSSAANESGKSKEAKLRH